MTAQTLVVPPRYSGPPGSGNGGWACGLIVTALPATTAVPEVTLHRPVPLGARLTVRREPAGVVVRDPADNRVASVAPRAEPIPAVRLPDPLPAGDRPRHGAHHLPSCHVCGPARADGLRLTTRLLPQGRTVGRFVTPPDGGPAVVWAALDCPGGWTVTRPGRPWLLGRFAVAVDRPPGPAAECVVAGRAIRVDGRKALVRTTLYASDGTVLARSEAVWIAPRPGRVRTATAPEEET